MTKIMTSIIAHLIKGQLSLDEKFIDAWRLANAGYSSMDNDGMRFLLKIY